MRSTGRRGFTLLEISITLAILGIVMAIVFGVFAQTIAAKERAEMRGDELASARAVLARITSDLTSVKIRRVIAPTAANAAPPTPTPRSMDRQTIRPEDGLFLGRVQSDYGVAVDDVAFSTFIRRPTAVTYATSDLAIVHYFVDLSSNDPRHRGKLYREALYSLAGQTYDPDKPDLGASVLLLSGVVELDLRYFDGNDWVDGWDSTDGRNFAPAPYAVQVRMAVMNEQGDVETYETAVDLPTVRNVKNPRVAATPRR
jgi:prepilin-type N-terminal cleavage/methylation domain-containing protein